MRRTGRWQCGGVQVGPSLFTVWPPTVEEEPAPCQRSGQIVTEVPVPCRRFETNVTEEHVLDKGSKNDQKGGKRVERKWEKCVLETHDISEIVGRVHVPLGASGWIRKGNRSIFGASTGLLKWGWYLEPPPSTTVLTMRIVLKPSRLATLPLHPALGSSSPPPSQIPRPLAISPFTPLCRPTTHCVGWPSLLRNVQSTKAITTY